MPSIRLTLLDAGIGAYCAACETNVRFAIARPHAADHDDTTEDCAEDAAHEQSVHVSHLKAVSRCVGESCIVH